MYIIAKEKEVSMSSVVCNNLGATANSSTAKRRCNPVTRYFLCICLILLISSFASCRYAWAGDLVRPDTVPDWYPIETCMKMMNILIDEFSLSVEGAASIIGNVCQESKFDPHANSGYYIGICQWDPYDRWPLISDWIITRGLSTDSAYAQLRAIYGDENGRAEGDRYAETLEYMKSVSSIEDGVNRWLVYYEGAAGQQEAERVSYAYDALDLYNAN